jgi:hypothetical protein
VYRKLGLKPHRLSQSTTVTTTHSHNHLSPAACTHNTPPSFHQAYGTSLQPTALANTPLTSRSRTHSDHSSTPVTALLSSCVVWPPKAQPAPLLPRAATSPQLSHAQPPQATSVQCCITNAWHCTALQDSPSGRQYHHGGQHIQANTPSSKESQVAHPNQHDPVQPHFCSHRATAVD